MQNTLEGVLKVIIGISGGVTALLIWWITKLLSDKKDIITNAVNIEHLEARVKQIEVDVKENMKEFHHYKDSK
jgi:precorrin-6B methylase 2